MVAQAYTSDLQRVWRLVQDLSIQLETNQEETERLRRLVEALDTPSGSDDKDLKTDHDRLLKDNLILLEAEAELSSLCADQERALERITAQIREYRHKQVQDELQLRKEHASQIAEMQQRVTAAENDKLQMQASVHHLGEMLRQCYATMADDMEATEIENVRLTNEVAALKQELGLSSDAELTGPDEDEQDRIIAEAEGRTIQVMPKLPARRAARRQG
ncbi:hypothetical protein PYCC9005_005230 [Savitreella phatthalungensis]